MADERKYLDKDGLTRYTEKVKGELSKKTTTKLEDLNGTALVFNETDGGGAKYTRKSDNMESYVGVNNEDMGLQLYVDKPNGSGGWTGATIKGYNEKFYYQNKETRTSGSKPDNKFEIAVIDDITTKVNEEKARAEGIETGKLNVLGNETGSGEPYKMTYFFDKAADTEKLTVTAHTITMDNQKIIGTYSMDIPSALSSTAGLMSGADKTRLDAIQLTDASVSDGTLTINKKTGNVTFTKTEVLDSLTSTSTDIALSANKGKELNDRIDNISSMGRFLSTWNCAVGKPDDEPGSKPYTYNSGDYYIVGNISSGIGTVNYRPKGSQYTGETSQDSEVEPDSVHVNDIYRYTTSGWVLQSQVDKEVAFSTIVGLPRSNTNLAAEFDKYIPLLGAEPGSGQQYHFPFNINSIVQNADSISTSFDTITLDGNKTKNTYPIAIPGADIANNKAGLYTKALADLKADLTTLTAETTRATDVEANLNTAISTEKTRAEAAEGTLTTNLATEISDRTNADTTLQGNITAEATARSTADTALENSKLNISAALTDAEIDTIWGS